MKAEAVDHCYNVGTGVRTSIKELAEAIIKLTGTNQEIEFVPEGQTFVKNRIGCPAQAQADLGFTAETGLEEGLSRLVEWRRSHIDQVEARRARAAQ
ncbi:MAG: hypothetical protein MJA83_05285 [Gammaproteobacteria bacterium]|nr:hypothetical protein [Gammaproteobacteria bacterium]